MPSQRRSQGSSSRQYRLERRTPISTGGTQIETVSESQSDARARRANRSVRDYSPTRAGARTASGVGLLEAEFLGCLFFLVLFLFADLTKSYGDKIMSTMKRGTALCILFFILSLIAGTGANAAKIAKGIGAMVFFAILLTAPVNGMLQTIDSFFKADWTGTGEEGTDTSATPASGTSPSATFSQLPQSIQSQIEGLPVFEQVEGIPGGLSATYKFLNTLGSDTISKLRSLIP
jgi:hypothetical protein